MWYYKFMGISNGCRHFQAVNKCERCEVEFQSRNPASTKYCPDCQKIVYRERNAERVRRFRESHKSSANVQKTDQKKEGESK